MGWSGHGCLPGGLLRSLGDPQITPSKATLGQEGGADHFLADNTQTLAYFKGVAAESDLRSGWGQGQSALHGSCRTG